MTDLDKLINAVEAGGLPTFPVSVRAVRGADAVDVDAAMSGSLDAAHRLHDALLPGWDYCIDNVQRIDPFVYVVYDGGAEFNASAASPARAWLLAILRALKAKEDAK
jgi:hypothetical protein